MNDNLKLEEFIETSIEEVSKYGKIAHKTGNSYSVELTTKEEFCGMAYCRIDLVTNSYKMIVRVSVLFPVIIDRSFYDNMIEIYGNPKSILAKDKLLNEGKRAYSGDEGFRQHLSKRDYSMKEVSFENKPFFILWEKPDYQIEMTFFYENNGTQLIFGKPTNQFLV